MATSNSETTKVILVVFDGCRPDALQKAHTPALDRLWRSGAYTWSAQTVDPSWSLPAHLSMLRGVDPQTHRVFANVFQPSAATFPSVIDVAHEAGLKTAMFYSWEQLRDLSAHGSLDVSYYRHAQSTPNIDRVIAEQAATHLIAEQPDLSLVYLGESDLMGHEHGWMSTPYLAAIEMMDEILGNLAQKIAQAGLSERFTWLVLSDHGGHDHSHGTQQLEDMTIFWILSGPRIKHNYQIPGPVNIIDTAATIAELLGVARPGVWKGRAVRDAFNA